MSGGGGGVELLQSTESSEVDTARTLAAPVDPGDNASASGPQESDSNEIQYSKMYNVLKSIFQQYSSSTDEVEVSNILNEIRKKGNKIKYEIMEGMYTLRYGKSKKLCGRDTKNDVSLCKEGAEKEESMEREESEVLGRMEVEQEERLNVFMMVAKQAGGDEKKRLKLMQVVGCYCLCECKKEEPCGFNLETLKFDVEQQKSCPNKFFRESDDYFLNDYNRSEGYSALSLVVAKGDIGCLKYLVEVCGASLLPTFSTSKVTRLFDKAFHEKFKISLVDFDGVGKEGMASIYSENGVRNFKRGLDESVLHVACRLGRLEAAKAIFKLAEDHCKIECTMAQIENDRALKVGFLEKDAKKVPRHLKWLLEPFQDEQPPFWCRSLPNSSGTKYLVPRLRHSRKDGSFIPERPGGDSLITDEDVENHPKEGKDYGANKYMSAKDDIARGLTYFLRDASGATCLSSICKMDNGGQIDFAQLVPVVKWLLATDQEDEKDRIPQHGGFHMKMLSASVSKDGTSNLMFLLDALASSVGKRFYKESILPAGKEIFDVLVEALGKEVHYVNEYTNESALYRSVCIPGKSGKDIRKVLLNEGAEKTIALAALDLSCYLEEENSKLLENAAKFGFERTPLEHAVESNADAVMELVYALPRLKFENRDKMKVKRMVSQAFRRAILKSNHELMVKLFNEAPQILEKIGVPKEATWSDLTSVFKDQFRAPENFEWGKLQDQNRFRKVKPATTYHSELKNKEVVNVMFSNARLFQDFICKNIGKDEYYFDIYLVVMKKHGSPLELYNKTLPIVFKALTETTHHERVLYWMVKIAWHLKKASKAHPLQKGDFEKKVRCAFTNTLMFCSFTPHLPLLLLILPSPYCRSKRSKK